MTFDYIYYLTKETVEKPSSSEQWAGQYSWFTAIGEKKQKADPLREKWKGQYLQSRQAPGEVIANWEWQNEFRLLPSIGTCSVLDSLPTNSFFINFTFRLQKPYLSKDDNDFHIIDNPLVRDKVFRWPMVRSSGWKGSLRHSLWQLGHEKDDEQIERIFGKIRSDDTGRGGRLHLYPTFFDQSSLAIINPHDRGKRVGKNPILLECVPVGVSGTFALLYVPFDRISKCAGETHRQVTADLQLVAEGIRAMLTTYGFGAKTSSGFGITTDTIDGKLIVNHPDADDTLPKPIPPIQPDSLRQIIEQHPNEDFQLKPNAWRKRHGATTGERNTYKQARADYRTYQEQMETHRTALAEWEIAEHAPPSPQTECNFQTFDELVQVTTELVHRLTGGEI